LLHFEGYSKSTNVLQTIIINIVCAILGDMCIVIVYIQCTYMCLYNVLCYVCHSQPK